MCGPHLAMARSLSLCIHSPMRVYTRCGSKSNTMILRSSTTISYPSPHERRRQSPLCQSPRLLTLYHGPVNLCPKHLLTTRTVTRQLCLHGVPCLTCCVTI